MRHTHFDGSGRRIAHSDDLADRRHGGHHHYHSRVHDGDGRWVAVSAAGTASLPLPLVHSMKRLKRALRLRRSHDPLAVAVAVDALNAATLGLACSR